jgi:hypothetical protein
LDQDLWNLSTRSREIWIEKIRRLGPEVRRHLHFIYNSAFNHETTINCEVVQ